MSYSLVLVLEGLILVLALVLVGPVYEKSLIL